MRLSIPLVIYTIGWFGTAFSRPIHPDGSLELQASRDIEAEGPQLRGLDAAGSSPRELLNTIQELDERHRFQELYPRARPKVSKAAQTARKEAIAAQANRNGKGGQTPKIGPLPQNLSNKKDRGKAKQNANNAQRKTAKNNRNRASGLTAAARQQVRNKANAGTNQWPDRNAVLTNGRDAVSGKDVRKATLESNKHTAARTSVIANPNGRNPRPHPHRFTNRPNGLPVPPARPGPLDYAGAGGRGRPLNMAGPGKEFAVTTPDVFRGGNPGTLRTVTDNNGNYKGVVSHDPRRGQNHPHSGDLFRVPAQRTGPNPDDVLQDVQRLF